MPPIPRALLAVAAGASMVRCGPAAAAAPPRPPNVVIVFTDDQGYADVGVFGARGFETPNLDRLAKEGAVRDMVADPSMSGVTCDLCHTIRGIDGAEPLNGNFLSSPSEVKFGPLRGADNAHHVFSPIQSRSEQIGRASCRERG